MSAPAAEGGGSGHGGFVAEGFESVREQFALNLQGEGELGAAFSATLNDEVVVDLWGGLRDADSGRPWERETLCTIFSGSKGLTATCLLRLIDRGLVDLDAPVCEYWPEFAARGKDSVLVRHVVSHQAGLPGIRAPVSREELPDAGKMAALLADQELSWPPGSRMWYHGLTFGWLCGELVRRVAGRPLGEYFREEIAGPLDLEVWIGLPPEQEARVATSRPADEWRGIAADGPVGAISEQEVRNIWHNPDLFVDDLPWSSAAWRRGEIPGANAIASARGMASFYGVLACGGMRGGTRVLSPQAIALGETEISAGIDPCDGEEMRFGVGWALQTRIGEFGPPDRAFGHGGAGGSVHGAWPEERVGFSYTMNLMRDDDGDDRAASLLDAVYRCVRAEASFR